VANIVTVNSVVDSQLKENEFCCSKYLVQLYIVIG